MSELGHDVGRAVIAAAGIDDGAGLTLDDHLALIAAAARADQEVQAILQRSVTAARAAGASWAVVGGALGMSRQAAQQRFGGAPPQTADTQETPEERWLGPVTAFDELDELAAAGRAGWHTVEAAMFSHRMVRTPTQWEHRRVFWRISLANELAAGWQVGCRAFPWIYLVRDLGTPAVGDDA